MLPLLIFELFLNTDRGIRHFTFDHSDLAAFPNEWSGNNFKIFRKTYPKNHTQAIIFYN